MSSKKKRVMAGNDNKKLAKPSSEDESNLLAILDTELFNVILQHLTNECAKALHMTCRTTNHWVRERLLPLLQHINQLPAARKEGILNQNVLHHISITDFINNIRPILNKYPNIKQGYLDIFDRARQEQLTEEHQDELKERHDFTGVRRILDERHELYELKRLALQYPELNEGDVIQLNILQFGREVVDIRPFREFIEVSRPFLINHPNIKDVYLQNLEHILNSGRYGPFGNQKHDALDGAPMRNLINARIYSLEHPNETIEVLKEIFSLHEEDEEDDE